MDLDYFIQALGVTVTKSPLPDGWWGAWSPEMKTIYICPELCPRQEKFAILHELAHAYLEHEGHCWKQEIRADELAAKYLVPICGYIQAIQVHDTIEAVADELEVHPHAVKVFERYLRSRRWDVM